MSFESILATVVLGYMLLAIHNDGRDRLLHGLELSFRSIDSGDLKARCSRCSDPLFSQKNQENRAVFLLRMLRHRW